MTDRPSARALRRAQRLWTKLRLRVHLGWRLGTGFEDTFGRGNLRISYAQNGEDLIAWRALVDCGIRLPRYLDIGAHHPTRLSNTALFHLLGARGMNIEPDPALFRAFAHERPRDLNLNCGLGPRPGVLPFYRLADPALNTFSATEARRLADEEGIPVVETIEVPVETLNAVLDRHAFQPDFLSIDTEGHDLPILMSLDWHRFRPAVVCVETLSFSTRLAGRKDETVTRYLATQSYSVHADTWINTLYVDDQRQGRRP